MYTRKPWGKGFTFQDAQGRTVPRGKVRNWLESLPVPPAWTEVEIAQDPSADLLATGRDSAGRKQYLYHPDYRAQRDKEKFARIVRFAEKLETMRRVTGQHLTSHKLNREKVLACMVRLLDLAYFRPGNAHYSLENETYGLTTMRSRHLQVEGDELVFCYVGKSGVEQERHVVDERLAKIVSELDEIPGYRIFKYFDERGQKHQVESQDLNNYIREIMGEDFSAKDFRTWAGTVIAAIALDELGISEDSSTKQERVQKAVERVAKRLGNTTTVARASYIAPKVIEGYLQGYTTRTFLNQIEQELKDSTNLSLEEIGLLYLLKQKL